MTNLSKMEIFLRSLSDPGFQISVGAVIGCHQTTVSKTIKSVMKEIIAKKDRWIRFPNSDEDFEIAIHSWASKFNIPDVIGAIDCTHIWIQKPLVHPNEYVNRKGFFSLNVQATCNADEHFTSVDVTWPGSVHDSRIWKNSEIDPIMAQNSKNAILLGDEGYGLTPWLLTPFKKPIMPLQRDFNKEHAKERVIIERMFGQLKKRFPMLHHQVRLKDDRIPTFIVCAIILHNVAKYLQDPDDFSGITVDPSLQPNPQFVEVRESIEIRRQGEIRRNQISEIIHRLRED